MINVDAKVLVFVADDLCIGTVGLFPGLIIA